jgi:hypothetical protein
MHTSSDSRVRVPCQSLRIISLPAHSLFRLFFSIRFCLTRTSTSTAPQTDPHPQIQSRSLVRKPLTNFNNTFDSRDKCVLVGIDRVHAMAARAMGHWDKNEGTK